MARRKRDVNFDGPERLVFQSLSPSRASFLYLICTLDQSFRTALSLIIRLLAEGNPWGANSQFFLC
jgi:hypothetical protein